MAAKKPTAKPTRTARAPYTDAQRADTIAAYIEHGPREAARRTGIPARTITRWAAAAGVSTEATAKTTAATQAAAATLERRKQATVDRFVTEVNAFLDRLYQPTVEKRVVVVSLGRDGGSEPEIVEVRRDRPTIAEGKALVWSAAVLWDKVQAATGGVTERIGVSDEREVQAVAADVLRLLPGGRSADAG